jgi:hypothetical protein
MVPNYWSAEIRNPVLAPGQTSTRALPEKVFINMWCRRGNACGNIWYRCGNACGNCFFFRACANRFPRRVLFCRPVYILNERRIVGNAVARARSDQLLGVWADAAVGSESRASEEPTPPPQPAAVDSLSTQSAALPGGDAASAQLTGNTLQMQPETALRDSSSQSAALTGGDAAAGSPVIPLHPQRPPPAPEDVTPAVPLCRSVSAGS